MSGYIRHKYQTALPDNPATDISASKWNDTHAFNLSADDITDGINTHFITTAQQAEMGNTSGTNTGDQNLTNLVPKTTTVNSKALSGNISLTFADVLAPVSPSSNISISAGFCAYFVQLYELVLSYTTEIGLGSYVEIG